MNIADISGHSLIAGAEVIGDAGTMRAVNPASGEQLEPEFTFVGIAEVHRATAAARDAFDDYRCTTPGTRARFLERIADLLDSEVEVIVARAMLETGLTRPRLTGELGRTTGQLRMFARELLLGASEGARIDTALPERTPVARPDIRQRKIPIGPVAVFGASNFPLAFSTAGGDTAAALAAGCPVIVKAHNSHPGTAELAGRAITQAVREYGFPGGTFSMLLGRGASIGQELVKQPEIAAVAFTGSRLAGISLMNTAAARPVPIPVFAEMASINPVIFTPASLADADGTLAAGLVGSLSLGSGQFCTNPGLLFVPVGNDRFLEAVSDVVRDTVGQTMLSSGIYDAFIEGVRRLNAAAESLAVGIPGQSRNAPATVIFRTTSDGFRKSPEFQEEVFGSAALVVEYTDFDDLLSTLETLQGQLTATVRLDFDRENPAEISQLVSVLERKVGRIIVNDWPTGVEVNDAVVHGGPFPAASDSRATSVGTLAIDRFLRPVAYQGFSDDLLPASLQSANPWALPRRVNGTLETKDYRVM